MINTTFKLIIKFPAIKLIGKRHNKVLIKYLKFIYFDLCLLAEFFQMVQITLFSLTNPFLLKIQIFQSQN